ncbi:resolvase [Streptomyces sp. NPDC053427]|uniref:resolvase n=1 Tax=Streptomyces sp. NPDC053427 TaxID=3365701 RepID=UPI0037D73129
MTVGRCPFRPLKWLGCDATELTALADHLTAHGLVPEMLAGPLPGIYDPTGPGKPLFAFFAAMGDRAGEQPRVDAGRDRHRGPQGQGQGQGQAN